MRSIYLSMITAALWGATPLFEKLALGAVAPLPALAARSALLAALSLAAAVVAGEIRQVFAIDARSLVFIALATTAGGFVGLLMYFHALRGGQASVVVPISGSYPLVTTLLAIIFLQEAVTPGRLLGAALVVAGVILLR